LRHKKSPFNRRLKRLGNVVALAVQAKAKASSQVPQYHHVDTRTTARSWELAKALADGIGSGLDIRYNSL
jgi:hypothetical protein